PGVPETHYAVPLRTFAWGKTDREANANMRAHAAQYPAAAKSVDEFTARLANPDGPRVIQVPAAAADEDQDDAGDAVAAYQDGPDPDPDITAGPDDEITGPTDEEAARFVIPEPTGEKLPAKAARGLVHDWLRHRAKVGKPTFTASDPAPARASAAAGPR